MMNLLKALRQDEYGVILSTEIVIIGSLLVIGLITGLTCLQRSVNGELQDLAGAIGALDQSYSFSAHRKSGYAGQCCAYTAGSAFLNCERQVHHQNDVLGCEGTCAVQQSACGNCGHCSNCGGGPAVVSPCGTCGGRAGGCSSCGSGSVDQGGLIELDTGVPGLRATEWPSSDCPVESVVPFQYGPIPEADSFNQVVPPVPMLSPDVQWEHPAPINPAVPRQRGGSQFNFPSHVW